MVDTPADQRSDKNSGDQFGGETQPHGHRGCSGLHGLLLASRLVLLEFAFLSNMRKALIQIG